MDRRPRDGAPSCVRLARRDLVWINVTSHPTTEWIARQITEAFPWSEAPRYLIRGNDAPDIAAMDLFVVPTIGFDLFYVLVIVIAIRSTALLRRAD